MAAATTEAQSQLLPNPTTLFLPNPSTKQTKPSSTKKGAYEDAYLELGILLERARAAEAAGAPPPRDDDAGAEPLPAAALEGAALLLEKLKLELLVAA